MSNLLIILPLVISITAGTVLMIFWRNINAQKTGSIIFSSLNLISSIWLFLSVWHNGIIVVQSGNWKAPIGISFVADQFAATLIMTSAIAALALSIYSGATLRDERLRHGFFPVFHMLIGGVQGAFLTGDIFNLFVFFEVIILSSFVILSLGGKKRQMEGAIKYVSLNVLASSLFLIGIGFLYGLTGTLNFADLSLKMALVEKRGLVNVAASLFLVSFGIKSAIFPLYFWLPASYHTPPTAITATMGGLLTKVGVYAMVRTFTLVFGGEDYLGMILGIAAALTIVSGGFGAMMHQNLGKVFGYLIICHIGFMIAGLAMFNEAALSGTAFYLVHDILVKTSVFIILGIVLKISGTQNIKDLGGLYKSFPLLSLLMAITLFSLVGIPPFSGFWPKIFFVQGGLESKDYALIFFIVLGSFITLWVIAKVWAEAFWKEAVSLPRKIRTAHFPELPKNKQMGMIIPLVFLTIVILYVGLAAENISLLSQKIGSDLMHPSLYIESVLGKISEKP